MNLPTICDSRKKLRISYLSLINYMARIDGQLDKKEISLLRKMILKFCLLDQDSKKIFTNKEFSKKHYKAHVDKPFYAGLEEFIVSGPVVAIAIEGIEAVELVRKMVGATEPKSAQPGTIRGDFSHHSYGYADEKGIAIKNLVHASGSLDDAKEEMKIWFTDEELHKYNLVHEKHTR